MATLLYRLGKTAYRRWPAFVAAWLVALIGVGVLAGAVSKPMVDTFSIPGIPSLTAQDLQKQLFTDTADAEDQASVTVVVAAPAGPHPPGAGVRRPRRPPGRRPAGPAADA